MGSRAELAYRDSRKSAGGYQMTNLAPIVEILKTLHETTNPDQAVQALRSESEAEKARGRI